MAGYQLCVWITIAFLAIKVCQGDPCEDYSVLPNDGLRYENFETDSNDPVFQDTYLTEGWYISKEPMLDHAPASIFRCGTKFPIWLNDGHQTTAVPEDKTVCQKDLFSDCRSSHTIQAAKCDDGFYRYYLTRTITSSAYCFGVGVPGTRSQYIPATPVVKVYLDRDEDIWDEYGLPVTSTRFTCEFDEAADEQLWYMVHWYQDGNAHYNTPFGEHSTDIALFITEDVFNDKNFRMGMNLSCSVTAFVEENGPPGRRSSTSENQFVGIKVITPNLAFNADETATIQLKPTIPIGCQGTDTCTIRLITYLPVPEVSGQCQPIAFDGDCGTKINSSLWENQIGLMVFPNEGQLVEQASYEVFLKIDDTTENKIWGNYALESVYVTTTSTGSADTVANKVCRIVNDPHYFTFDNWIFDDHDKAIGTKIVYWHPEFDTEVQISTKPCNDWIHCICGVAARAGLDVYVWDICDEAEFIGYRYCAEKGRALTVRARNPLDITIYFPYGTYVHVTRWWRYLNANIYPTTRDRAKVRGLCGNFDGITDNEFHLRNGSVMSADIHDKYPRGYWSQPVEFLREWTAQPTEDLFSENFDMTQLSAYGRQICVCEELQPGTGGTEIIQDGIPCTQNGAATCKQGTPQAANNCADIQTSKRRRKSVRSPRKQRLRVPRVTVGNLLPAGSRTKRETNTFQWTEELARQHCIDEFNSTDLFTSCSQIESLDTGVFSDVCTIDIQLTNTTDWLTNSINAMGTECKEAILRNVTRVREAALGDNPVYSNIDQAQCTDISCSGRGTCENGECVCEAGAGGADCSVDLTVPPSMAGLVDGGLCDASISVCNETFVFGGHYINSDVLKCKVKVFVEDESGNRRFISETVVNPDYQTYLELKVQLPAGSQSRRRRRRSTVTTDDAFVSGYTISVTNDGQTYSVSSDLFVYDSTCQQMQELNGTIRFTLNTGYCFIENQCVLHGEENPTDNCTYCDQAAATRQWTLNTTKTEHFPEPNKKRCTTSDDGDGANAGVDVGAGAGDSSSTDTIIIGTIGAVGGLVFIAAAIVLVWIVLKKVFKPKATVGSSTLFDSPSLIRSDTGLNNANLVFKPENLKSSS